MKKLVILSLLLAFALPGYAAAEVEAGAGNITLMGHIDFMGRYSTEDEDEGWNGYETYNLEFAVVGMKGMLGDNVSWCLNYAFAFMGPGASMASEAGAGVGSTAAGTLLDARINLHMGDTFMLSAGRFIPPTSMTWAPHMMSVLHTVNYPLINGSGYRGGLLVPLPMYQTGVMATAMFGPVTLMVGSFNGAETFYGNDVGGGPLQIVASPAINNVDIDKAKGTAAKIALSMDNMHFAGWYYGEEASVTIPNALGSSDTFDGMVTQWGIEAGLDMEMFFLQAQYLSSTTDAMDSDSTDLDDLVQYGWYLLAGVGIGDMAEFVVRYDYVNYDDDEIILGDDQNEEMAWTLGLNYMLNENTTIGLDYTIRQVEYGEVFGSIPAVDEVEPDINELALIIEVDLF